MHDACARVSLSSSCSTGVISAYNHLNNGLLRSLTGHTDASITVTTWPMPRTADAKALVTSTLAIIVAIAFAFIPASFVGYAVKEESDKAKHQQMISGSVTRTHTQEHGRHIASHPHPHHTASLHTEAQCVSHAMLVLMFTC